MQGSFAFVETFGQKYSEFFMESLDVDSLFTNIPLKGLLIFELMLFLKALKECKIYLK